MSEWWQKSGHAFGIGKSEYSMRSREVLMCSERYAADIPLRLPNAQLASDLIGLLEAVEGNAPLGEDLGAGDARGAGADDARVRKGGHEDEAGVSLSPAGAVRSSACQPTSRSRSASSAAPPPRIPNSRLA